MRLKIFNEATMEELEAQMNEFMDTTPCHNLTLHVSLVMNGGARTWVGWILYEN
jgi:hypothetical protein